MNSAIAAVAVACARAAGTVAALCMAMTISHSAGCRRSPSLAPARDDVGLVVEPQSSALLQHVAGCVEITAVRNHCAEPVVLDLRHVDGGIPGGEQRRGADRFGD